MKRIVYTVNGNVCVVNPAPAAQLPEETEDQFIARIAAKDVPEGLSFQIVDAVPADRTFRNAWTVNLGAIEQDMPKCRAIWRDRMRDVRKPKLEALDILWMRATARSDATAASAVESQREQLRNVTAAPSIETALTPAELKAVWPAVLS